MNARPCKDFDENVAVIRVIHFNSGWQALVVDEADGAALVNVKAIRAELHACQYGENAEVEYLLPRVKGEPTETAKRKVVALFGTVPSWMPMPSDPKQQ